MKTAAEAPFFVDPVSGDTARLNLPLPLYPITLRASISLDKNVTETARMACLAKGMKLAVAVRESKVYIDGALQADADIKMGIGHEPVHHFHKLWDS